MPVSMVTCAFRGGVPPPRLLGEPGTPERASDDLQVDLAYAALDVHAEVGVRFAVGVVDVGVAHLIEPFGVDLAKATFGFRLDPDPAWQQYRCLSDPALYAGVEVPRVIAREIHRGLASPHLKVDSRQGEAVQIQITLPRSHLNHELGGHFVVHADVPLVACATTEVAAIGATLLHDKLALLTAHAVAHLGLPLRDVVGEVALHKLVCATGDVQLSSTHLQLRADGVGVLEIDRFRLFLHLSDLLRTAWLRAASPGEDCRCGHHDDRECYYKVT